MLGALVLAVPMALIVATPVRAQVPWPSGAFTGYGIGGIAQFQAWRGAPVTVATDYMGGDDWSSYEDPVWTIDQWASDKSVTPDLSFGLWATGSGGTLGEAASGAYNGYYKTLAQNLVAAGLGHVALRPGWEFNQTFYPWSVTSATAAAQYAAAWRQLVTAMRSVPGADFTFVWCPALDNDGIDPALAYPGNHYVNVIGLDVYDWNLGDVTETPVQRWDGLLNASYGLNWQASFAAAHGRPIGFPEWGLVDYWPNDAMSGNDDPTFVQNMFNWFGSHDIAFEDYFNSDESGLIGFLYDITDGNFAQAASLYQKLYSGS